MARDLDSDVQALVYLVTVLIHRLHETDPAWWREFRDEIEQIRTSVVPSSTNDKVLGRALSIVEESIKGHADG